MWSVQIIGTEDVAAHWALVAPLLDRAVRQSEGRYSMRSLYDTLLTKKASLWVVYDERSTVFAAFTTSVRQYPLSSWLCVDFLGGADLELWVEQCDKTLSAFARDSGLAGLELVGRKGWCRALAAFGWRDNAVLLTKHIDEKAG